MSREPRRMEENVYGSGKLIVYIAVAFVITVVIVSYALIGKIVKNRKEEQRLAEIENAEKQMAKQDTLVSELPVDEDAESVSTEMGKTVEESSKENSSTNETANTQNEAQESANTQNETKKAENNAQNNDTTSSTSNEMASSIATNNEAQNEEQKDSQTETNETNSQQEQKELTFVLPVEGEVVRGYAKDNLVYSETLQEWIIHQAVDIKANSRDVVKASADGTVTAIKNDPRYGLTVIIEHDGGFKTVYSNLLTAEFVVVGEQVKQGQTLGTVGSSATFEIADEPHLHFEMLKDSEYVDPTIYIK